MDEVSIVEASDDRHAAAFRDLNLEWITKLFEVEPSDNKVLNDPQGQIIDKGGFIMMAMLGEEIIGTCALVKVSDDVYELAKMAVTPRAQGRNAGYLLGKAVIEKARDIGAKKVFLLTNSGLHPALSLYRKLGFIDVPLGNADYKRSDVRMEIALDRSYSCYI